MQIGLDLDGVIVDSIPTWVRACAERLGEPLSAREIVEHSHATPARAAFFEQHEVEFLIGPGLIPGAAAALQALKRAGHELVVVTARTPRVETLTAAWLAYHGITVDRMHFLEGGSKLVTCQREGIELFVEDAPHNARALTGGGIPVLLFDQPHNQDFHHPLARRCHGWLEVLAAVAAAAADSKEASA